MTSLPRVAWFSPIYDPRYPELGDPGSASAYVSHQLLPYLRERFEIEVFHDRFSPQREYTERHFLSAFQRHREKPFDIFFHQLEDRPSSRFIRIFLGIHPGIVWFHDLLFADDGPEPILNSPWQDVAAKFNGKLDSWPDRSKKYKRGGPLGKREAGLSLLPIFSCERDHIEYKRHITERLEGYDLGADTLSSFYLPYPVTIPERKSMSRNVSRPTIVYCGSYQLEHRAHKLLQALSQMKHPFRLLWLVDQTEKPEAERLVEEFDVPNVEIECSRSPFRWQELVQKAEIAVHTVFSAYGQPGPYLEISLAAGLPTLVTRFGATEFLPANVAFQIEAGEHESTEMGQVLHSLLAEATSEPFPLVREFAREHYDKQLVADDLSRIFMNALEGNGNAFVPRKDAWQRFEMEAWNTLIEEAKSYHPEVIDGRGHGICSGDFAWERLIEPAFSELGWSRREQ